MDLNRERKRKDPVRLGADLKAAKDLATAIPPEKLNRILGKFLDDDENFLAKQGHPLRLLPNRINAYLNPVPDPNEIPWRDDRDLTPDQRESIGLTRIPTW